MEDLDKSQPVPPVDYMEFTRTIHGPYQTCFSNLWNANNYMGNLNNSDRIEEDLNAVYEHVKRSVEMFDEPKDFENDCSGEIQTLDYIRARMTSEEYFGFLRGTIFMLTETIMGELSTNRFVSGDVVGYYARLTVIKFYVKSLISFVKSNRK